MQKEFLKKPGENTQSARLIRFRSLREVKEMEPLLMDYLREAIRWEKAGLKVDFKAKSELTIPDELQKKFQEIPRLQTAFTADPRRQRGIPTPFYCCKAIEDQNRVSINVCLRF